MTPLTDSRPAIDPTPPPRGLTLVELLVVIVILTTLVTTAIPVLAPGGDDRRIREASRSINAYLAGAQARAIETGRPFGVAIRRLSADTDSGSDNGIGVALYQVEVPPPYSGFDDTARMRIARSPLYAPSQAPDQGAVQTNLGPFWMQFLVSSASATTANVRWLPAGYEFDLIPPNFFRVGDLIETQGHVFRLTAMASGPTADPDARGYFPATEDPTQSVLYLLEPLGFTPGTPIAQLPLIVAAHDREGQDLPPPEAIGGDNEPREPYWSEPARYKVYRQPTEAGGDPLQLPAGIAIDLQGSGFPGGNALHRPGDPHSYDAMNDEELVFTDPVTMLFSPEGTLTKAYFPYLDTAANSSRTQETLVTSSLALLVGRVELIPAEPTPQSEARNSSDRSVALNEPIDLANDLAGLSEEEEIELRNQYNWLNLDSRWVVVGAQSGTVTTVQNSFVNPNLDEDGDGAQDIATVTVPTRGESAPDDAIDLQEQLAAARAAAPRRVAQGGR